MRHCVVECRINNDKQATISTLLVACFESENTLADKCEYTHLRYMRFHYCRVDDFMNQSCMSLTNSKF